MRTITLEEFQREGAEKKWRMLCPACGNIASPDDFKKLGADPQRAAQECIGRAMTPRVHLEPGKTPCDWAAFGLFKTLGKGMHVKFDDDTTVETFEFAS